MSNYSKRKPKLNKYDLTNNYGIGYTSKGDEFYFDMDDYERIKNFTWFKDGSRFCAIKDGKKICLHRFVTNCPKGMVVDHINHDIKDNRKQNLRICTDVENKHNRSPKDGKCCGVSYRQERQKWYARIGNKFLGYFNTEEEAVEARREAEIEWFGDYSYISSMEKGFSNEYIA